MTQPTARDSDESTTHSPSRRTIVAGAAWTIPIIAMTSAAPAYAASQCDPEGTLDWATGFTKTGPTTGTGTGTTPSGQQVGVTVSSVYGANVTPTGDHLGTTPEAMNLGTSPTVPASGTGFNANYMVTTTFTFASPVSNLRFYLADIEWSDSSTREYARVANVTGPITGTPGSALTVLGGFTPPFYSASSISGSVAPTDPTHQVQYVIAGPITSFQVQMSRPVVGGPERTGGIGISDLKFVLPC